jgi:hypothetical protein
MTPTFETSLTLDVIAYTNTKIVFSEPVPDLDKKVGVQHMACADAVTSPDSGKTWQIPTIKVEKSMAPEQFVKGVKKASPGASGLCGK